MGILSKLFGKTETKAASETSVAFAATSHEMVGRAFSGRSVAGKSVTEETAMGIGAAWACIRIIAETIGSIPWAIFRSDGKGNATKAEHELGDVLIRSPNANMTSVEYREALALDLCRAGNGYSFIERSGQRVVALIPVRAGDVRPMLRRGSNTALRVAEGEPFFRISDRGKWEDFPRDRIWHIKGFGDGLSGLSPIGAARETMGVAMATEEFAARFFSQGGAPSGVVSTEKWLSPEQRTIARDNLNQMLGGLANAHKFALFEGGMKPEPWGTMPLEDMEFLALRKFSVQEICRFYRIPPHMVADLDRATFSNIEHLSQEFVTFTLMPYLTRFEASVAKWLLRPEDRSTHFLRFNFEGLLRADSAGRAAFYSSALQNGWMSRNEVRAKENLNRVAGLDEFTVQTNLTPVEELAAAVRDAASGSEKSAERIKAGFEALAKQRRKMTMRDGEEVLIEPVYDFGAQLEGRGH